MTVISSHVFLNITPSLSPTQIPPLESVLCLPQVYYPFHVCNLFPQTSIDYLFVQGGVPGTLGRRYLSLKSSPFSEGVKNSMNYFTCPNGMNAPRTYSGSILREAGMRTGRTRKLDCEGRIQGKHRLVCFWFSVCVGDTEEGHVGKVVWGHGWWTLNALSCLQ